MSSSSALEGGAEEGGEEKEEEEEEEEADFGGRAGSGLEVRFAGPAEFIKAIRSGGRSLLVAESKVDNGGADLRVNPLIALGSEPTDPDSFAADSFSAIVLCTSSVMSFSRLTICF